MGIGGIGINAVQGAAHAGGANIIAIDPLAYKRETAQQLGATHAVETMEEATELAQQFTNGLGADSGDHHRRRGQPRVRRPGHASIRKGGTVVVTGAGNIADTTPLPVSLADLTLFQKRIQGSCSARRPDHDILRQVELYRSGELKLDELITKTYTLDEVTQGYEDMHAGKNSAASSSSTDQKPADGGAALGTPRRCLPEGIVLTARGGPSSGSAGNAKCSPSRSRPGGTSSSRVRRERASPRCCAPSPARPGRASCSWRATRS